jgi:hypothetical protein
MAQDKPGCIIFPSVRPDGQDYGLVIRVWRLRRQGSSVDAQHQRSILVRGEQETVELLGYKAVPLREDHELILYRGHSKEATAPSVLLLATGRSRKNRAERDGVPFAPCDRGLIVMWNSFWQEIA